MKFIFSKQDIADMAKAVSAHGKDNKLIDLCNTYLDYYNTNSNEDIEVNVIDY